MKSISALCALLVATSRILAAEAGPATTNAIPLTPEFVNWLTEELRTNHPALQAASARTNAAAAAVGAVRSWEDPMLRLGGMFAEESMRQDEGDIIYGVEQKLPLFGKPQLSRRVAQAEVAVAQADVDYRFQLLRRDLSRALFKTALAGEGVRIGGQDLAWLEMMERVMEDRYRTGDAGQSQLLRVQNERARRRDQLRTDAQMLEHEQVGINRLLNRDLQSAWPALALPAPASPIHYNSRLVGLAVKYEPKLRLIRRELDQAEAATKLTRRQRYPDFSVGVQGRNYSGDGEFRQADVMVGFNFPWGNNRKYRSEIARDDARLKSVEREAADYELSVREEVHLLTVKIDAARREALLYRDEIVPRSEQALAAAQAAWMSGGGGMFLDVMEARRMLLEARLMYARAVSEQYLMMSELVLCCGLGDLEALQMIGVEADSPQSNQP